MKNKNGLRSFVAVVLGLWAVLIGFPTASQAALVTIDGIVGQGDTPVGVSGTADFVTVNASMIQIVLSNTSPNFSTPTGAGILLTGIAFNLPSGLSITSGSAYLYGSSVALGFTAGAGGNVSSYWGWQNSSTSNSGFLMGNPFGSVTNTALTINGASVSGQFPSNTTNPNLNGPSYGLLSNFADDTDRGGQNAIKNSILITLNLTGTPSQTLNLAYIEDRTVVLSFGSPTARVPEASALMLFGSGLVGLVVYRRKKRLI